MPEYKTNFAILMDLLDIRASELCRNTGADKTLVSRWRSGKRKLMPGRHWAEKITAYFIETDEKRSSSILADVLRAYYPVEPLDGQEERQKTLARWLTTDSRKQTDYQEYLKEISDTPAKALELPDASEPPPESDITPDTPFPLDDQTIYGIKGARGSVLQYLDLMLNMPFPQGITLACPEGLDMFIRDEKFCELLLHRLTSLFAAGHHLSVILRTDYKMTDVSAFSGHWLVFHLMGHIKSYYFDEFHKTYNDKLLTALPGRLALCVMNGEDGLRTSIHFTAPAVDEIWDKCRRYKSGAKQRFHYGLFERPDGFLQGILPAEDRPSYLLARLPHFCVADKATFQENFKLSDSEMALIALEFPTLLTKPAMFSSDTRVCHFFCENDIEEALLKSRHVSRELSTIVSRRVVMPTQKLVEQLDLLKRLLMKQTQYELCFLPDEMFQEITLQIAVWSDRAAIGWIAGGRSTACKDYTNVNALAGFCGMIWDGIPNPLKQRRTALRKLDTWLKKAGKYGYQVPAQAKRLDSSGRII